MKGIGHRIFDFSAKALENGASALHSLLGIFGSPRLGRSSTCVALAAVLFCSQFSCGKRVEEKGFSFERRYWNGPVVFTISLSDSVITIAQRIRMLLEVRAESGYRAELPSFGEKLSEFGIVDYRNFQPELAERGEIVTKRLYVLEPFLSGEYKIPPMEVRFFSEGDSIANIVESDTISILVKSLIGADTVSLSINEIVPPIPYPWDARAVVIVSCCILVAIASAALFFKYRRIGEKIVPPLPAHEKAYLALKKLLESGLLDEKKYREFAAEVTDILRRYIEDRFGLKAPERTTEEFLVEASFGLPVTSQQKELLKDFLMYGDLVKFAALEPSPDDLKGLFDTCKDFIEATKESLEQKASLEKVTTQTQ